jgi:ankyrin repeat protein
MKILLDAGADVNANGDMGASPLYFAVMRGHVQVAELLLQNGANPDASNELGFTPRSLAKHKQNKAMLALFRRTSPKRPA